MGASSRTPKGCGFNSPSGHMLGLWVGSLVGEPMAGNQSLSLSLSQKSTHTHLWVRILNSSTVTNCVAENHFHKTAGLPLHPAPQPCKEFTLRCSLFYSLELPASFFGLETEIMLGPYAPSLHWGLPYASAQRWASGSGEDKHVQVTSGGMPAHISHVGALPSGPLMAGHRPPASEVRSSGSPSGR